MRPEDFAQEIELQEWEARQKAGIMQKPARQSAKWCEAPGCGERIPEKRRKAVPGVQYCVECQERIENVKGKYARTD